MKISLLLDFYSPLLKENGRKAVELYYNDDLSLFEISEELGITRQGVRDLIKRNEKNLNDFESQLGLYARFVENQKVTNRLIELIDNCRSECDNDKLLNTLSKIKATLEMYKE